uniref:Pentacotripeptide-repeat region of PRORP domain-containing protein n=1 Tax=Salix viminalis TaxID=40686 RepID=A0A6N2M058_SALVM
MREMGFVRNVLSYNVMLNLYYQMGKYEKLEVLMQEMEKWATSNIEEIKKKLMKMEADPLVSIDWYAYVVAANGYLKAGLIDKTLTMLWRSEQLISGKSARFACETLLSLYTAVGNKEQVYRVWNLYKTKGRSLNSSYHCTINSLLKLDGVDGAERI